MASSSDPRTRGTVKLDHIYTSAPLGRNRIPVDLLLGLLLTKTVLASAALLARHWLLTDHSEAAHGLVSNTFSDEQEPASHKVSAWAITTVALFLAALAQALWFRIWEWAAVVQRMDPHLTRLPKRIGVLAALVFFHTLVWIMTLTHLPATNVIIFTQYCEIWAADFLRPKPAANTSSSPSRSSSGYSILIAICISFLASVAHGPSDLTSSFLASHRSSFPADFEFDDELDIPKSLRNARPEGLASPSILRAASAIHAQRQKGAPVTVAASSPFGILFAHGLLVLYALLTIEKERAMVVAARETGGRRRAMVLATVAAAAVTVPLGLFGSLVGLPTFPTISTLHPSLNPSRGSSGGHLAAYLLIALGLVVLEPLMTTTLQAHASLYTCVRHGWPLAVVAAMLVGFVGFGVPISLTSLLVAGLVGWGLRSILIASGGAADGDGVEMQRRHSHRDSDLRTVDRNADTTAGLSSLARSLRGFLAASNRHINTILASPDSRKIFQFLCLNLAFMGVQLAWGVWTNSLGLISDAIHMFFDCAAIGMGLFASVMANWKNDKVFTYGYGRVETLSGFANGVFLILISVFIVFEAIQRIIEPPVMHNTTQLLIVSGMGLLVNLFGMFAMGGHHHHHHGHSHGHGHDHHHHGHGHGHDHGHSHNMMGVYLHVMADTLGSVGVIISTLLIEYYGWTGFDPIASLFIAFLIVGSVIPLVVDAGKILVLDIGDDKEKEVLDALAELDHVEGVASYSNPRIWPKDAESFIGTIRLQVQTCYLSDADGSNPKITPVTSLLAASSIHNVKGSGSGELATIVEPELLARTVERILKSHISGLQSMTVQLELSAPAPSPSTNNQDSAGGMLGNGQGSASPVDLSRSSSMTNGQAPNASPQQAYYSPTNSMLLPFRQEPRVSLSSPAYGQGEGPQGGLFGEGNRATPSRSASMMSSSSSANHSPVQTRVQAQFPPSQSGAHQHHHHHHDHGNSNGNASHNHHSHHH
ncbi:putative zinc transporter msc2 [Tilletia horrida]|uniref:Zinc transporter msc2 n=1 Tax=Tilletia horrida TaxID=155126 RepID=A0AAN6JSP2_9BASI|nr:putative zinc transporter msc2 [Tilletia horrida]KAK0552874.1 putative zinc transporter msc2 [Tilletia horrida]KAK0567235.1 putative zinc transporter msc2 [Tilletia horrida]